MNRWLPTLPMLLIWLAFSIIVLVLGYGFSDSPLGFTVHPSPAERPADFALWITTTIIVLAPLFLLPVRILIDRKNHAPNH